MCEPSAVTIRSSDPGPLQTASPWTITAWQTVRTVSASLLAIAALLHHYVVAISLLIVEVIGQVLYFRELHKTAPRRWNDEIADAVAARLSLSTRTMVRLHVAVFLGGFVAMYVVL
jgi:hypothetical protein